MTTLATPVMVICLMVTVPEVNNAERSTVLSQNLTGCTVCNLDNCKLPPEFERLARELNRTRKGRK
jgi:hypothetical protein